MGEQNSTPNRQVPDLKAYIQLILQRDVSKIFELKMIHA